jgi:hypothetical protein
MKFKNLSYLVVAAGLTLGMVSCGGSTPTEEVAVDSTVVEAPMVEEPVVDTTVVDSTAAVTTEVAQ